MHTNVEAYQKEKLEKLAENPQNTVYEEEYNVADAWKAKDVSDVLDLITTKMKDVPDDTPDFTFRKSFLEDKQILEFQRRHPKLYYMVTDREKMKEEKYRSAISAMMEVRRRVEAGDVDEGRDADAAATRTVINALSSS